MHHTITARNVNQAFREAWWWLRTAGIRQESRNGPVLRAPGIMTTTYTHPTERILWSPRRDANPVFHLAECLWMLAGYSHAGFLEQFNSRIMQYADADGHIWGAYGRRWRGEAYGDQLPIIVDMLKKDPTSRQAVLQMWNSADDLGTTHNDRPCNLGVCFEIIHDKLNMTVFNRSNDMLWGAYGANVVHMSFLQEVLAHEIGVPVGTYSQVSNNFHVYLQNDMVQMFLHNPPFDDADQYTALGVSTVPILQNGETLEDLTYDCQALIDVTGESFRTHFVRKVAYPLLCAYLDRKNGFGWNIDDVPQCDWKLAFQQWCDRRSSNVSE